MTWQTGYKWRLLATAALVAIGGPSIWLAPVVSRGDKRSAPRCVCSTAELL